MSDIMSCKRTSFAAVVALLITASSGCGGSGNAISAGGRPDQSQNGSDSPAADSVPTTAPCPTEALVVNKPQGWTMVHDFSGQQVWQGTATIMNPNPVNVNLVAGRTFALTTVTLKSGKQFPAYTGKPVPVLPAGAGPDLLILAGRTVEMHFSMTLVRPSEIVSTEMFGDVVPEISSTSTPTCHVPLSGAKPVSASARGPRLCGQEGGFSDLEALAAVGRPGPSDQPACG